MTNPPTEQALEEAAQAPLIDDECKMYHGTGGVVIHPGELGHLFNLLQDNPRPWNRRLRRVTAAYILHLRSEGKLGLDDMEYYQP